MDSTQIIVNSKTGFVPQQSEPEKGRFVFFYTITIENNSTTPCQLLSRHWIIQDADGKTEEVQGEGVIGEQPIIAPQDKYTYSSGAILETEMGTMEGRYFFTWHDSDAAEEFAVMIPKFILSIPRTLH
ncbi:MAG: Co2+/Mg2+ efflux protein ApaG [Pseudomonadota bacterium]